MTDQMTRSDNRIAAVIVAAGKGLRAGQAIPKQFAPWRGTTVLRMAAERLREAGVGIICVAIPEGAQSLAEDILIGLEPFILVTGGTSRQESVRAGLEALEATAPQSVLIHDAARPDCPADVIKRLIKALDEDKAAIPVLPVVDSMVIASDSSMSAKAERDTLRRVQTPQAFRFTEILSAHRNWTGVANAGDDAQIAHAAGHQVALVDGDERLAKLTFAEDFKESTPMIRTGSGFDVHRLATGEELWLCGIKLEHDKGLAGHSDADVALHAVVDAILGAVGEGDIGQHFPPSDPQWRGAPSSKFVEHAVFLAKEKGFAIGNVDLTIMCEAPKIGPHRNTMRSKLAELLSVQEEAVNVKATTTEKLGFTGRGEGIAAQAVATLIAI